jgi:protein-S-isoprenylcysteine O-methyltransferase
MNTQLRLCFLALYAVGPAVALLALLRRRSGGPSVRDRVRGWRWYVPVVLLPVEWLLPPVLILLGLGESQMGWLPVRLLGFIIGLGGAALLVWASATLGRFLVHEAAVFPDHALITRGPYRLLRHPIYSGYLAVLLGSALGTLNVCLLLLWPISLVGILVQAGSEEQLLGSRFGEAYHHYARRTGQLVPRWWATPDSHKDQSP